MAWQDSSQQRAESPLIPNAATKAPSGGYRRRYNSDAMPL